MSRKIIHDLVLPIVLDRLNKMGYRLSTYDIVHDENLETFLDEELSQLFSICGKNGHCEELEKAIKEAQSRDTEGYKQVIHKLLEKYINLRTKIMEAKIKKKLEQGPPDRFKKQLEKAKEVWHT